MQEHAVSSIMGCRSASPPQPSRSPGPQPGLGLSGQAPAPRHGQGLEPVVSRERHTALRGPPSHATHAMHNQTPRPQIGQQLGRLPGRGVAAEFPPGSPSHAYRCGARACTARPGNPVPPLSSSRSPRPLTGPSRNRNVRRKGSRARPQRGPGLPGGTRNLTPCTSSQRLLAQGMLAERLKSRTHVSIPGLGVLDMRPRVPVSV